MDIVVLYGTPPSTLNRSSTYLATMRSYNRCGHLNMATDVCEMCASISIGATLCYPLTVS